MSSTAESVPSTAKKFSWWTVLGSLYFVIVVGPSIPPLLLAFKLLMHDSGSVYARFRCSDFWWIGFVCWYPIVFTGIVALTATIGAKVRGGKPEWYWIASLLYSTIAAVVLAELLSIPCESL